MEGIKNYLSDMDGVILRGTTLIPGAAEFVQNLLSNGIPWRPRNSFVTSILVAVLS
jgi:NagD protein